MLANGKPDEIKNDQACDRCIFGCSIMSMINILVLGDAPTPDDSQLQSLCIQTKPYIYQLKG